MRSLKGEALKVELSIEIVNELLHFANQYHYNYLKQLIKTIGPQ